MDTKVMSVNLLISIDGVMKKRVCQNEVNPRS